MGKSCDICGKPSGMYPLCKDCFKLKNEGKIVKCEECGTWYLKKDGCPNCIPLDDEDELDEIGCILCGKPSNEYFFCRDCYYKYRNKEILVKISNCEFPCGEPLSVDYEGKFECDDGHIVKSQAERDIDNELFNMGIFHAYEIPLDVGTEKPLRPDFCLKNYLGAGEDVYIEYFGLKGQPKYDEETTYKLNLYSKNKVTLICMYPQTDLRNIKHALKTKLKKEKLTIGKIHYFEE